MDQTIVTSNFRHQKLVASITAKPSTVPSGLATEAAGGGGRFGGGGGGRFGGRQDGDMQVSASGAPLPTPGPMPMRAELRLLRADCGSDYRRYCSWVQPGGGRAIGCLVSHGPQLQPVCRSALREAAASFR
jgi:hypothetical protein